MAEHQHDFKLCDFELCDFELCDFSLRALLFAAG
jgi:hypothetical protein